jgi:NADPH:quinone reductase-like Zn-dependent oxidoreductase
VYFVVEPSGAQLGELAKLVDDGKLRAAVSATFGLAELREAFAAQQARSRPGKIVVTVAG